MHGDGKRPDDGDDGEVDEDGEIAVQWQNQNVVMENALASTEGQSGDAKLGQIAIPLL
jgi:hypothetical protein